MGRGGQKEMGDYSQKRGVKSLDSRTGSLEKLLTARTLITLFCYSTSSNVLEGPG